MKFTLGLSFIVFFVVFCINAEESELSTIPVYTSYASAVDTENISRADSTAGRNRQASSLKNKRRKSKLIKREFNYRNQVVTAVSVMTFIAIILTTSQNMNP